MATDRAPVQFADVTHESTHQESLYARLVSRMYDPFLESFEEKYLRSRRARLISGMKGRILEVGSGTGVNLALYTEGARVTALEPSASMMNVARKKLREHPVSGEITLLELGVHDPHVDRLMGENSLDGIVSTLVLCTIPDPEEALGSFRRWLKPGGELVVLEHIRSHHPVTGRFQDMATPLWKKAALGCHLNRDTDGLIRRAGFRPVEEEYFSRYLPFYQAKFRLER